ncbi:hypothetical protein NGUA11_03554 [Salmonella enterica]|nr:hypothetical protein NGUA11_03554 [Salmonella enterica]
MLVLAFNGSTPPVQFGFRQHFTGRQRVVQQRYGFVQRHGKNERLVRTLAARLPGLWIGGYGHVMQEFLYQHFILVTLHVDIADRICGECTSGDIALGLPRN